MPERTVRAPRAMAFLLYCGPDGGQTMCHQCPLISTVFCVLTAGFANAAQFIPLGFLEAGSLESWATDVSTDGNVVVGTSVTASGQEEAFSWTFANGMTGLGDLPGGVFTSNAEGTSAMGIAVVGGSYSGPQAEAFRWSSEDGMIGLGGLGAATVRSYARDVSSEGSVIVGVSANASSNNEAFRWTEGLGMVGLGDLDGGVFDSDATAVSADGAVVVGGSESTNGSEAFRWTENTGMMGLGDLEGGTFSSQAGGLSADGSVVVGRSESANGSEAFRWTENTGMEALGDLAGGPFESSALGTNSNGTVIVGVSMNDTGPAAFIWDMHHGMRSLQDVLSGTGADLLGWQLTSAAGISADGRSIVGWGWNPVGTREAWLAHLSIPEPSSSVLVIMSCFGLALARIRLNRAKILLSSCKMRESTLFTSIALVAFCLGVTPAVARKSNNPGGKGDPALDNPAIAFVAADSRGHYDIVVASSDLSIEIPVTQSLHPTGRDTRRIFGSPVWSPDGQALAFWAQDDWGNSSPSEMMLYVSTADGTQTRLVRDFNLDISYDRPNFVDSGLVWSDSGRELVYDTDHRLIAMDLTTGETRTLLDGWSTGAPVSQPALSPDLDPVPGYQGFLATVGEGVTDGISDVFLAPIMEDAAGYLKPIDYSAFTNITNSADTHQFHPSWSPDGTEISIFDDGDLAIMNLGSGITRRLPGGYLTHVSGSERAAWTSDGRFLLYHSAEFGWTDISMIAADGNADPVNYTSTNNRYELAAVWNPIWSDNSTTTSISDVGQVLVSIPEPSSLMIVVISTGFTLLMYRGSDIVHNNSRLSTRK